MIYIALIAVITVVLLQFAGAIPDSSVGGPMTMALVFFTAALVFGIFEAWSNKRGVFGFIVSIAAAIVGGVVAAMLGGMAMDVILPHLNSLQGSLAATRHPMLYITSAGMMILTLLGSWIALWIVNRLR